MKFDTSPENPVVMSGFEANPLSHLIDLEMFLIRRAAAQERGWHILPAPSGAHFSADQAGSLANAINQSLGSVNLVMYQLDGFHHLPASIRLPCDAQAIFDAGKELSPSNSVMIPDDAGCLVFCTVVDYF